MTVADGDPLRGTDSDRLLKREFENAYWADLQDFVEEEGSRHDVYPPRVRPATHVPEARRRPEHQFCLSRYPGSILRVHMILSEV